MLFVNSLHYFVKFGTIILLDKFVHDAVTTDASCVENSKKFYSTMVGLDALKERLLPMTQA